jgi:hypothetical protein
LVTKSKRGFCFPLLKKERVRVRFENEISIKTPLNPPLLRGESYRSPLFSPSTRGK